jgi:transcriptional regulator with GAF, ATPase, and Fis domain
MDFRLIVATNDDLDQMVKNGQFREDLYYRICVIPIFLPPLRKREGDIPLLLDHYLKMYCTANDLPQKRVSPEARFTFSRQARGPEMSVNLKTLRNGWRSWLMGS